jgi:hypothetical protein
LYQYTGGGTKKERKGKGVRKKGSKEKEVDPEKRGEENRERKEKCQE